MFLATSTIESLSSTIGIDLTRQFLGNMLADYLTAFLVFVGATILFRILQVIVINRLRVLSKRTKTDIDDTLIRIVENIKPPMYLYLAFYLGVITLSLNTFVAKSSTALLLVLVVYQVVHTAVILIDYLGEKRMTREESEEGEVDPGTAAALELVKTITKIVLWIVGFLLVLSNLGIEITSLIAGLGIGGIAIAFALQAILGDLFSSFTIYFDKPFKVGDFIVVGDMSGTVERVGIKTTRLRALQGEEIVLSNADLTSSRIHNYKHMEKRRIVFTFGVLYETAPSKLKKIPEIVEQMFSLIDNAELDRVHFNHFGDSSLDFEVVYFVLTGDYNEYMNVQQTVNFTLLETFEEEEIEFAYPTRTVYIAK